MHHIRKLFIPLFSLLILAWVLYFVEPPKSWQQATYLQLGLFFVPLLTFFMFVGNIFLNYLPASLILGLGLTFLVVLKSVDQLNILTSGVILIALVILVVFLKKTSNATSRLTKNIIIPKLTRLGGK